MKRGKKEAEHNNGKKTQGWRQMRVRNKNSQMGKHEQLWRKQ